MKKKKLNYFKRLFKKKKFKILAYSNNNKIKFINYLMELNKLKCLYRIYKC